MTARPILTLLACMLLPALGGCVARTAFDVATAPVRVAGKAADLATTSQSEADAKRGREIRRREERLGKLDREYHRNLRRCQNNDADACAKARDNYAEMQDILPTMPYEPR